MFSMELATEAMTAMRAPPTGFREPCRIEIKAVGAPDKQEASSMTRKYKNVSCGVCAVFISIKESTGMGTVVEPLWDVYSIWFVLHLFGFNIRILIYREGPALLPRCTQDGLPRRRTGAAAMATPSTA